MSYPKQKSVLARLEKEVRKDMRDQEDKAVLKIQRLWNMTKSQVKAAIAQEYRKDFNRQRWTLPEARNRGTLFRIEHHTRSVLDMFKAASVELARRELKDAYREESLRSAWILDNVTPPNLKVKFPHDKGFREAGMVSMYTGAAAQVKWYERWSSWVDAFRSTLNQNIMLGAINESEMADAMDEVEASRVGSPAYDMWDILERIYRSEAIGAQSQAREDIADINGDMDLTEVWQTMEDGRVCEICDPNDGLERDEVDDEIPAHPLCRCFWRMVPKEWADMLDRDQARKLDELGVVPDAMVIVDPETQKPAAAVIVDFGEWRKGMGMGISAEAIR